MIAAAPIRCEQLAFAVPGSSRVEHLTWAQQHMMAFIEALHPATASLNPRFTLQLRSGLRTEQILFALRDLMEAHEALRTLYVPPPEGPGQRCVMAGTLSVDIVKAPSAITGRVAAEAAQQLGSRPFDISRELPVRIMMVCADEPAEEARYLAIAVSHLVIDFEGTKWMRAHLSHVSDKAVAVAHEPPKAHQPRQELDWERSPLGRRTAQRAIRSHEQTLRAMPATMLPRVSSEPEEPRFHYVTLDSPALAVAVAMLAQRQRVSTTAVLYAAVATFTGYLGGLPRAQLQLTVGNRIQERTRCAVGMFTQDVPAVVELAGASVADVVSRANSAIFHAARFGQYPPAELNAMRAAVELDRGVALDLSCWLNYRRAGTRRSTRVEQVGGRTLAQLKNRTRWRWSGADERSTSTYFIHVDEVDRAVVLTMLFDSAIIPRDESIEWLRSLESLLCAAAMDADLAVADVAEHVTVMPGEFGADWCVADSTQVHLPTATSLLRTVAGTAAADVFAVPAPDGSRLVAYLAGSSGIPIARLHAQTVAALPALRTAMAPHSYVVCAEAPRANDLDGWRRCRVLAEGTGRTPGAGRSGGS